MAVKNLIYLCSHLNTVHNIKLFGADLKNKGIKITVISLLPLTDRSIFFNFYRKQSKILVKNKNFKFIFSLNQFYKLIKNLKGDLFFINASKPSFFSILIENFLVIFKKGKKIAIITGVSHFKINSFKKIIYLLKKIIYLF